MTFSVFQIIERKNKKCISLWLKYHYIISISRKSSLQPQISNANKKDELASNLSCYPFEIQSNKSLLDSSPQDQDPEVSSAGHFLIRSQGDDVHA